MMLLDTIALALLRPFRKFSHLQFFGSQAPVQGEPHAVAGTRPEDLGIQAELEVDGKPVESYQRSRPIHMPEGVPYGKTEGILTFRGDPLRSGAAYGPFRKAGKLRCV